MRPLLGRRCPVHVDAFVTEHRGDGARDRLSVDLGEQQAGIIGKHAEELAIVVGRVNDEIVARRRVPQHLVELANRVVRLLGHARGHPSPHRQADVVARFRMHLIDERLVVQEVDLDRPGRLDRFRTWYQPHALT